MARPPRSDLASYRREASYPGKTGIISSGRLEHAPVGSSRLRRVFSGSGPLEQAPVRLNTLRRVFLMFFPVKHCFFRLNIVFWEKTLFETANTLFFGFKQCVSRKNNV